MTDSRRIALRAPVTVSILPSSRETPMIGCTSRATRSPRRSSAALTESTRNGQSSLLVSSTEPSGSYPSCSSVGLNARTATGARPRSAAKRNAPSTSAARCSAEMPPLVSRASLRT